MNINELRENPKIWQILEQRARDLARREDVASETSGEEVLAFTLGESSYALPIRYVYEVQPFGSYTRLPGTPAFIVGLVNVRGRLLVALDIRPLLDVAQTPLQAGAALLIVGEGGPAGVEVGLLADSVIEVRRGDTVLTANPSAAAGQGAAWIRGVDSQLCLQIELPILLADPRLVVNSDA